MIYENEMRYLLCNEWYIISYNAFVIKSRGCYINNKYNVSDYLFTAGKEKYDYNLIKLT